jgi:hypothetical protein
MSTGGDVDGRIILKFILEKQDEGCVDWIHDGDQWPTFVNTVMNLRVA